MIIIPISIININYNKFSVNLTQPIFIQDQVKRFYPGKPPKIPKISQHSNYQPSKRLSRIIPHGQSNPHFRKIRRMKNRHMKKDEQQPHIPKKSDFDPIKYKAFTPNLTEKKLEPIGPNPIKSATTFVKNTFNKAFSNNNNQHKESSSCHSKPDSPVIGTSTSSTINLLFSENSATSLLESATEVGLPYIVPPPPPLKVSNQDGDNKQIIGQNTKTVTFSEEIANAAEKREQRFASMAIKDIERKQDLLRINHLIEHGLFYYANESEKLSAEFYAHYEKIYKIQEKEKIELSETAFFKNPKYNLGLLEIAHVDETNLLLGTQTHLTTLYQISTEKYLAFAYLTSEKGPSNVLLSSYQPFGTDEKKAQYLRPLSTVFIVKKQNLELLSPDVLQKGVQYINDPEISKTLQKIFVTKIIPKLNEAIPIYDGRGITNEEIDNTQEKIRKIYSEKAKNMYNDFIKKNKINTEEKVNNWLSKLEKFKDPLYPYIMKIIKNEK